MSSNKPKADMKELIDQLFRAKGKYTFNKFATLCDVAPSYFSRIVNQKVTGMPQPDILKKIAACSQDSEVTYQSLMIAAGFAEDDKKELKDADSEEDKALIKWALNKENREYLRYIYNVAQEGFPKELLYKSTIMVDIFKKKE